jgi:hypothetical protein
MLSDRHKIMDTIFIALLISLLIRGAGNIACVPAAFLFVSKFLEVLASKFWVVLVSSFLGFLLGGMYTNVIRTVRTVTTKTRSDDGDEGMVG